MAAGGYIGSRQRFSRYGAGDGGWSVWWDIGLGWLALALGSGELM